MKKIAIALVLSFLMQFIPMKAVASEAPPPGTSAAVLLGAVAAGYFLLFENHSSSSAKKTGNEFADLNNNNSFKDLLNQVAGGSKDTLEILK